MKNRVEGELQLSDLRRNAALDPVLMRQLRRVLAEGALIPVGSMSDAQLFKVLEHWTEAGRLDSHLFSGLVPSLAAPALAGSLADSTQEAAAEQDGDEVVESEVVVEHEQEVYELEFVLVSEETGHVLPFHPFKVFNDAGQEVGSGKTDEEGRALIDVDREAEYEVLVDTEETYNIAGQVLERGSLAPVPDAGIEITADEGDTYTITSGPDGRFQVSDVAAGYQLFRVGAVEHPIFLESDLNDLILYIPAVSVEEQALDEGDEEVYLHADDWVLPDIQPEDY